MSSKLDNQQADTTTSGNETTTPSSPSRVPSPPTRRRHKQLSTESLNWGIPHNAEATLHVKEDSGQDSWRYQLIKTLHGRKVQIFLASLLLLDVLILFCELALLTLFPSCSLVERDAISCCPVAAGQDQRWLGGGGDASCEPGYEPRKDIQATCDASQLDKIHMAEVILITVTISILSVFFLELTASMVALTPAVFFRQVFYAVDYFIVTVSLGLEVAFFSLGDEVLASLVGLVIMGRLWRFVRIGHGIVELTEDLANDRQLEQAVYTRELEKLLEQHGIPLPESTARRHGAENCNLLEKVHNKHIEKKLKQYHQQSTTESSA